MKKVLFLIHDLGEGGAEKVLVNLVNNMDYQKFDVTVMSLFDVGINKQFLSSSVKYKYVYKKMFPGNSHIMKLLSPRQLHNLYIKEQYDLEISYLEGPCARIISGCPRKNTKLVCWIHREMKTKKFAVQGFRDEKEAVNCYNRFDKIIGVSEYVVKDFQRVLDIKVPMQVLYNTNETNSIIRKSDELIQEYYLPDDKFKLIGVGKLLKSKGFDRILRITKKLHDEGYPVCTYILGVGEEQNNLLKLINDNNMASYAFLLGYQTNPYKYVKKCDLFVCASYAEGFSTATTEALIVGTPVCTVEVSGMKEMLGISNEYGIITENSDDQLYEGIKLLLSDSALLQYYKKKAIERGKLFDTKNTVNAVENMLLTL